MGAMQTRIIAVIAVAVIIIGGGAFVLHSKNSNPSTQEASNQTSPSSSPASGGQTFSELLSMGGNKKCTFSVTAPSGGTTQGTMYVSDANLYGDMVMTSANGKVQNTHIIRVGEDNYIWGDSLPTGMKMKLSLQDLSANMQGSQAFNPTQKTNFDCTPAVIDQSKFTPPANVKFTDAGSLTAPSGAGSTGAPNPNAAQCSACNSLTGSAKTACLSSLHCQ